MSNGNLLQEARSMVEKEKITTAQAIPLILAMVADMYEGVQTAAKLGEDVRSNTLAIQHHEADHEKLAEKQKEQEEEITALQLSDKRWGTFNTLFATAMAVLAGVFGARQ